MNKRSRSVQHANTGHTDIRYVEGELRLAGVLDKRLVTLLQAIELSGSLNQAAKQVGLSYKGAWQIIERANNASPKALLSTATGGSKGGGSQLTAAGKALLNVFAQVQQEHEAFLQALNRRLSENTQTLLLLRPLSLKSNAANQLFGRVRGVRQGEAQIELQLSLSGGSEVCISVSNSEWQALQIGIGDEVLMLVNAGDVLVFGAGDSSEFGAPTWTAEVIRLQQDGVDCELDLRLQGGNTLTALLNQSSAQAMQLAQGERVSISFNANAVILAALNPPSLR
jgi:molybdate transport system regulatory protein